MPRAPRLLVLVTAALLSACADDSPPPTDAPAPSALVPDPSPLTRMTAEQYQNTVRDLFAPAEVGSVVFPAELEGRGGFQNDVTLNTATPALVESYQRVARQVTDQLRHQFTTMLGCDVMADGCARDALPGFAERAWRRPLAEDELQAMLADFDGWAASSNPEIALTLSLQSLLQSPEFLYFPRFGADAPAEGAPGIPLTSWELAARLSYFLWNSMPDEALFERARDGSLLDRQVLADEAFRMLADGRAVDMVVSFHRQNWDFDDAGSNPIDLDFYAPVFEARGMFAEDDKSDFYYLEYSPQLRFESDVFVSEHVFRGEGKLRTLLTSNRTWTSPLVAEIAYQSSVDENLEPVLWTALIPSEGNDTLQPFAGDYFPLELDPTRRAGYFTMAGFLTAKAGPQQPAPVRRGVTILERLMCTELHPPGDVPPLENVDSREPRTNRERYAIHSEAAACAGCHASIDGIGFTFEHYDSMGRWRDTDNDYPVDATGRLLGTDNDGEVNDAVGLMQRMGDSRTVHDCYTKQWFRYAFGRSETAEDEPLLATLQEGFWNSDGNILELIVNLAGSYSFRHRSAQ